MVKKKYKVIFSKKEVLRDVRNSLYNLNDKGIKIKKAYLFGSYAHGCPKEYSDIDVAIVSQNFKGIRFYDNRKIIYSDAITNNFIETHPFKIKDWTKGDPFVREILKTGIKVW